MDGERMHPGSKLARRATALIMRWRSSRLFPRKAWATIYTLKCVSSARPMPGMTFVQMGFVCHAQVLGRESLTQLFGDEIVGRIDWRLCHDEAARSTRASRTLLAACQVLHRFAAAPAYCNV